ncbi:hypothetical protein GCM10007907_23700 [Chitinimonas prasina]|uniref:Uncharacterized protein n=1 Tax=Chitinimonas prasina TaxID=1434937 RepID=A0ABQ5YF14_9NEIS|nr:hypothetical protein GCM10007907_23700 [Chitinimonas prasina]
MTALHVVVDAAVHPRGTLVRAAMHHLNPAVAAMPPTASHRAGRAALPRRDVTKRRRAKVVVAHRASRGVAAPAVIPRPHAGHVVPRRPGVMKKQAVTAAVAYRLSRGVAVRVAMPRHRADRAVLRRQVATKKCRAMVAVRRLQIASPHVVRVVRLRRDAVPISVIRKGVPPQVAACLATRLQQQAVTTCAAMALAA